jgi:ribosomal protein S18 acetylase RimI-like enzyme
MPMPRSPSAPPAPRRPAIEAVDPVAATDEGRRGFIAERVAAGETLVALDGDAVVGYLVLDHAFFGRGFVVMLCVHPKRRRRGIGRALMRTPSGRAAPRIFTSTNRSNLPMQRLLEGMGYRQRRRSTTSTRAIRR